MAKNPNIYKFEIIESIIAGVDFTTKEEVLEFAKKVKFPVVAKVVGPVHKSDIGGVALNIRSEEHLIFECERMMNLPDVKAIMVQPMLKGQELFL